MTKLRSTRAARAGRRQPAVMVDVARLAGVSYQTVSRVLHDSPHVKRETRERVLDAIRQLNYRPSLAAQTLVTGRSRTLGVVSIDTTLYGPASTLFGVAEAAHDAGYAISVASLKSLSRASVVAAVERLRGQAVDGIVVVAPQRSAVEALRHLTSDVPVVAVESGPDETVPVVAVDQNGGAAAATRHLLELGHRTVWHIAGPSDYPEADQRIDGWRGALVAAGAEVPPLLRGDWSARSGYELAQKLARTPGLTAIFVANDQMALGVLRRFYELGLKTPGDISLVGFDDIPEAAYFSPPLTTVRQDFAEVGRRCLRLLLGQIDGGARAWSRVVVPSELVLRQSTTVPAARPRRKPSAG